MIRLSILPTSSVPVYRQIAEQIASQILSGELAGGTPLPPIRTVSRELGVSVITVRSAWEALEADGLIVTRAGSGCFVAEISLHDRTVMRSERIGETVKSLIAEAKNSGIGKEELKQIIDRHFGE